MRLPARVAAFAALTVVLLSCSDNTMLGPGSPGEGGLVPATLPPVRFSEIHYDNTGADAGEAIEVSGPAGTDLTGYSIVLYNGNPTQRNTYSTTNLSGLLPTTCGTRGVVVANIAGIQNGGADSGSEPDGMALVGPGAVVIEFLSYEGSFIAANGPAAGLTSTDIGVRELGTTPVGESLQRTGTGTWNAPAPNTFGACNDDDEEQAEVDHVVVTPDSASIFVGGSQQFTATAYDEDDNVLPGVTFTWSSTDEAAATVNGSGLATGVAEGDTEIVATAPNAIAGSADLYVEDAPEPPGGPTFVSEIHYDNTGADAGERLEVEGPSGLNLSGWSIVLYNGNGGASYATIALSGVISDLCDGRGVVVVSQAGIQNGNPDGWALVNPSNVVVEFLSYGGTFAATNGPANGMTSTDIGASESGSTPVGYSLKKHSDGNWYPASAESFGVCNGDPPPPPPSTISFSGRVGSDPPLPVGFQDQLFATLRDPNGNVVATTFTWSSDTPGLATIDQDGVVTALAAGTMVLRATADVDGTTNTYSLPSHVATASATADYEGNAEFGEPEDGDASDDYILRYDQFTSSYNPNRRTPNWVSYEIEATHFGPQDRCDCFTFDHALPLPFVRYTTAAYTGSGAFHGFGIDRGHLARSFDRTAGSLDNAFTYYFSNIVPQAADNNQGPWAEMENDLGDFARFQNKEVYVVAGVAGSQGTLKNEGLITIPAQVWKVAVVMDRDEGLDDVNSASDIEVIAVLMPNVAGIRNVDWHDYETTVDAVEAASGYDLLALLPDQIEIAVESGSSPPNAATDGPYAGTEGSPVAMSGSASSDPDGHTLTYDWDFGDGESGAGENVSHTYAQDGVYTVELTVTDPLGLNDDASTSATIANVPPSIAAFAGATLLPGETYTTNGSFTDPGADPWSATVDYGDGGGQQPLALAGKTFALSHVYGSAGTFTVTVRVSDDDVTSMRTATVTVLTPNQGLQDAIALVNQLVANGDLNGGNGNALTVKLSNAQKSLGKGNTNAALGQLGAFLNQLDAFVQSGKLTEAEAAPLRELVERVIESIS